MKLETIIYIISTILIVSFTIIKIFHLPYASVSSTVVITGLLGMSAWQSFHVSKLKKRILQLETAAQ